VASYRRVVPRVAGCCSAAILFVARVASALEPASPVPEKGSDKGQEAAPPRAGSEVSLLHTVIISPSDTTSSAKSSARETSALARAHQLDVVLSDALQDFGLMLDLSERAVENTQELTDLDLVARAAKSGRWVVYPSLDVRGSDMVFRLAGVAPGSKVVLVRTEVVKPNEVALRATVMLRDVITSRGTSGSADAFGRSAQRTEPAPSFAVRARSQGRATLAFNAALFGGFVGYSVQRGSGSDDPRLLFPLLALGTGIGLGASAIVAEEWDVGIGDAWFLSAAAWWPALSGLLIARSRDHADPASEHSFALIGAMSGLGLATTSLALVGGMGEGGALMTHSGGAFGTFFGGMTELAIRGTTEGSVPYRGLGYGAGAGVVLAGTVATFLEVEPSRVLAIDLVAGLGGLAGAAATSPFIFRERTSAGDRAFLIATMGATVAGGVAAWVWTRKAPVRAASMGMMPYAGVVGESWEHAPVLGVGLSGVVP
jgi:hypothetical protein